MKEIRQSIRVGLILGIWVGLAVVALTCVPRASAQTLVQCGPPNGVFINEDPSTGAVISIVPLTVSCVFTPSNQNLAYVLIRPNYAETLSLYYISGPAEMYYGCGGGSRLRQSRAHGDAEGLVGGRPMAAKGLERPFVTRG